MLLSGQGVVKSDTEKLGCLHNLELSAIDGITGRGEAVVEVVMCMRTVALVESRLV